ncbi:MAG: phage portal protein, partial [Ruminococcus sp.]|nr:phage portal protein [Ruminococcus sp.]
MNSNALEFVRKNYGCLTDTSFYSAVDIWTDWWKGYHRPFHRFSFSNGIKTFSRDFYTLKMGKKICEDWASLLLNDKTRFKISDENASRYVQGRMENGGVFGSNDFRMRCNRLIEQAFATGTGAVTLRLENADITEKGKIKSSRDTVIRLCFMSADYIIPISCENGRITEAAFVSEHIRRGRKYLLIEAHMLEGGRYVIHNHWFDTGSGGMIPQALPEGMTERFETGSEVPWFALITPNIVNTLPNSGGMGISVLHSAIDALKSVDLNFNNFCKDFELGGKKVFMLKDLTAITGNGETVAPDDVGQQLFVMVEPDSINPANSNGGKFIQEFNPLLRVEENTKGIQASLDYLAFLCGLGNKHYQFNSGSVVTATQYTGDKQDLIQNAHKHYASVTQFLQSLIRSVISIGNRFCGWGVTEDAKTEIVFDKSVIIDEAAER